MSKRPPTAESVIADVKRLTAEERKKFDAWIVEDAWETAAMLEEEAPIAEIEQNPDETDPRRCIMMRRRGPDQLQHFLALPADYAAVLSDRDLWSREISTGVQFLLPTAAGDFELVQPKQWSRISKTDLRQILGISDTSLRRWIDKHSEDVEEGSRRDRFVNVRASLLDSIKRNSKAK